MDARSDLFSLGAVLYEMATGRPPFEGDTPAALVDAILHASPLPPRALNGRLPRGMGRVILKALEKDPRERWQSAAEMAGALRRAGAGWRGALGLGGWRVWLPVSVAAAAAAAASWCVRASGPVLHEKDSIVVADFQDTTGDEVLDVALRQVLLSQLGRSRRLGVVSEERIRSALALSGHEGAGRLSPAVAREVCQRLGSKAVITSSIGRLGDRYFIALHALGYASGEELVSGYAEAESKGQVLATLGSAASQVRARLGESLVSLRELGVPAEATTRSLDALKAYSAALTEKARGGEVLALLQHAVELDPEFASAWFTMAQVYFNRGEEAMSRAHALRERTSERERLAIETGYHTFVSGDVQKAIAAATLAAGLYPLDPAVRRLAFLPLCMASELDKAMRIARREVDAELFSFARYIAAVLDGDASVTGHQGRVVEGRPLDLRMLALHVQAAAYFGRLRRAFETARAAEGAGGLEEASATINATLALAEAVFGFDQDARARARAATRVTSARRAGANAAMALALANDPVEAERVLQDLLRRYPDDRLLQSGWSPAILGAIALSRGDARTAIAATRPLLGSPWRPWVSYVRGRAFLEAGLPEEAVNEFRAILQAKGRLLAAATFYGAAAAHPAARVGLARALARKGDIQSSRRVYEDFLATWSRADADIPLLTQARREYARSDSSPGSR